MPTRWRRLKVAGCIKERAMKRILCIGVVLLLMGCATVPKEAKWSPVTLEVYMDAQGEFAGGKLTYQAQAPDKGTWQKILDTAIDAGKKAGGL